MNSRARMFRTLRFVSLVLAALVALVSFTNSTTVAMSAPAITKDSPADVRIRVVEGGVHRCPGGSATSNLKW
ncbi:MAG: hypothetical protein ABI568_12800 [Pseudarthrobacter sp.]